MIERSISKVVTSIHVSLPTAIYLLMHVLGPSITCRLSRVDVLDSHARLADACDDGRVHGRQSGRGDDLWS